MANQLGTNPMIIDSVMASAFKDSTFVSSATWMSPSAAGQKLVITDSKGNLITEVTAPTANQNVDIAAASGVTWPNGFKVTTIDGGKLALFLC